MIPCPLSSPEFLAGTVTVRRTYDNSAIFILVSSEGKGASHETQELGYLGVINCVSGQWRKQMLSLVSFSALR